MSTPVNDPRTDWQRFFDAHAPRYEENGFTKHTAVEVDFFLSLFPIEPGSRILDVGCGTGRHAIELARRGYEVTGVDISAGMLTEASRNSKAAGVEVQWVREDATKLVMEGEFDAALCLCEGGVGLIGQTDDAEEHDMAIFRNIANCLVPHAPFLLTAMNGYSIIRQMKDEHVQAGRFDPATMMANYQDEWELPEGPTIISIRERLFIPPEMGRMLTDAGFRVDRVFGGTAGAWAQRPLSLDEIEAMYVCRRT
jgi:SAM-dependent methyltransferase